MSGFLCLFNSLVSAQPPKKAKQKYTYIKEMHKKLDIVFSQNPIVRFMEQGDREQLVCHGRKGVRSSCKCKGQPSARGTAPHAIPSTFSKHQHQYFQLLVADTGMYKYNVQYDYLEGQKYNCNGTKQKLVNTSAGSRRYISTYEYILTFRQRLCASKIFTASLLPTESHSATPPCLFS